MMTTDTLTNAQPLKAFFKPRTLSELGALGHILTVGINYEATEFDKTGMLALAGKMPILKSLTPFRSPKLAMDIDISCVVLDKTHQILEKIWYGNLRGLNNSIRLVSGLYGATTFDESLTPQESIDIHLNKLPNTVEHIIFVISSYHKHPLSHTKKGIVKFTDSENKLIDDYDLATTPMNEYGMVLWTLERCGDDFRVSSPQKMLGENFDPTNLDKELEELASKF